MLAKLHCGESNFAVPGDCCEKVQEQSSPVDILDLPERVFNLLLSRKR